MAWSKKQGNGCHPASPNHSRDGSPATSVRSRRQTPSTTRSDSLIGSTSSATRSRTCAFRQPPVAFIEHPSGVEILTGHPMSLAHHSERTPPRTRWFADNLIFFV